MTIFHSLSKVSCGTLGPRILICAAFIVSCCCGISCDFWNPRAQVRPKFAVDSLAFSHDGQILVAGGARLDKDIDNNGLLWIWATETWKKTGESNLPFQNAVRSVAFSPDGKRLAVASAMRKDVRPVPLIRGRVLIWNWPARDDVVELVSHEHESAIQQIAYSHNGAVLVTCDVPGNVDCWDAATTKELFAIKPLGKKDECRPFALSPDSLRLFIRSPGAAEISIWSLQTGKRVDGIPTSGNNRSIAVSPNGTTVAAGLFDGHVHIYDIQTHKLVHAFDATHGESRQVVYSPDGGLVASGHDDGYVLVWNVDSGQLHATIDTKVSGLCAIAFSPSGSVIAAGGIDGLSVWNVSTGKLVAQLLQ